MQQKGSPPEAVQGSGSWHLVLPPVLHTAIELQEGEVLISMAAAEAPAARTIILENCMLTDLLVKLNFLKDVCLVWWITVESAAG